MYSSFSFISNQSPNVILLVRPQFQYSATVPEFNIQKKKVTESSGHFELAKLTDRWYENKMKAARAALNRKHIHTAEKAFVELKDFRSGDERAWIGLAICKEAQFLQTEAKEILQQAAIMNPTNPNLWKKLADFEKKTKNFDSARLCYRKAVIMNSKSADLYDSWGRMEKELGNLKISKKLFERGIMLQPSDHRLWQGLGIVEDLIGDSRAALFALRNAARLSSPDNPHCQTALALAEFRQNKTAAALSRMQRGAWRNPSNTEVWYTLGRMAEKSGDVERARRTYTQAARFSKVGPAVWATWAHMEEERGNYKAAARVWSMAAQRFPEDVEVWVRWAKAEIKVGRYETAEAVLGASVKRWPEHPWTYQTLAEYEMERENFEQARKILMQGALKCQESAVRSHQFAPLTLTWALCEWRLCPERADKLFEWTVRLATPKQLGFVWFWWAKFIHSQGRPSLAHNYLSRAIAVGYTEPEVWNLWQHLQHLEHPNRAEKDIAADLRNVRQSTNKLFWKNCSQHPLMRQWTLRPVLYDVKFDLNAKPAKSEQRNTSLASFFQKRERAAWEPAMLRKAENGLQFQVLSAKKINLESESWR